MTGTTSVVVFRQSTFAAFQAGAAWSKGDLERATDRLLRAGLLENTSGLLKLTPLGEIAGQLGVESVVRVASAVRGIPVVVIGPQTLVAAAQVTAELHDVYIPTHKKSRQERARWQVVREQQRLPARAPSLIRTTRRLPPAASDSPRDSWWVQVSCERNDQRPGSVCDIVRDITGDRAVEDEADEGPQRESRWRKGRMQKSSGPDGSAGTTP